MMIRFLIFVILVPIITSCTSERRPPLYSLEVYTTHQTRYEVVDLVKKFALRENLIQSNNYESPSPTEASVSINFADAPQKNAWLWVSNENLVNKEHVQVFIFRLAKDETCDICKKLESSDEMKAIKEKFEIHNVVKNGNW